MQIYRTQDNIIAKMAEHFRDTGWKTIEELNSTGGMILTEVTDFEHDSILNLLEDGDPLGLRGFQVNLLVHNSDGKDPSHLDLVALPQPEQIIRHGDRYYLVKRVLQSSEMEICAFVQRLDLDQLAVLTT